MQNLPTDSLYKFCALSGILILLISVYFPIKMDETIMSKIFETTKKQKQLQIETKYLSEILNSIKNGTKDIGSVVQQVEDAIEKSEKKEKPDSNESIKIYEKHMKTRKMLEESRKNIEESRNILKSLELNAVETEIAKDKLVRLHKQFKIVWRIGIAGGAIGILLAFYGFLSWYFRIQVYQDRIIKGQTEQMSDTS